MNIRFEKRTELAPGVWQSFFSTDSPVDYLAGQYAEFSFVQDIDDHRGQSRVFTLTSVPGDVLLSIVYHADGRLSNYKRSLQALRVGDTMLLGDTLGDLVLPKLTSVPLVFVAGGIGMASYAAMLKLLSRTNERREIHMLYGLRNTKDDAFQQLLQSFPFASSQYYISPTHITAADVLATTTDNSLVYLSGSENFVNSLRAGLRQASYSSSRVIFDYYDGYVEL